MCNNVVALGNSTADGRVIFGKNSDREVNEAHEIIFIPRTQHPPDSLVHCTYVDIPQVEETYAVMLARPSWIWGAEMAANEHGLVIGNTAVFTKVPYETGPGLIGMDFLRLAVERTRTARAAVDLITGLLATYGQGGNDGFLGSTYYHNSFIIADPTAAWVLETAGKQWAARQVVDVYATTNALTIETKWDLASPDLVTYAMAQGWCKDAADFSFKQCYGGPGFYPSYLFTLLSKADERELRLDGLLETYKKRITPRIVMDILRDHGPAAGPDWSPGPGLFENTVCMHAGWGIVRSGQTAGSMVSHLDTGQQTHWITGSAAPCTGIFKPVWLDAGLPNYGQPPSGRYNYSSLWWRHEALHREVLRDYALRLAVYQSERDQMETGFVDQALALADAPVAKRANYTAEAFAAADAATARWLRAVRGTAMQTPAPWLYRRAWQKFNRASNLIEGDGQRFTDIP